jgi:hypothetical protein
MAEAEIDTLLAAGPPETCTTAGVYAHCGPAAAGPPPQADVQARRLFDDFSVLAGKDGYERSYEEAGALLRAMGKSDGFDAMFSYRFS